jgi:hypothetical protein
VRCGLLWLAFTDLRQAGLQPRLVVLAIAAAILAIAVFGAQIDLRRSAMLGDYEQGGAATFIAELAGVADSEVDALADAIRALGGVKTVEAPYSGIDLGLVADTSFLVFQNDKQQEYLGARTTVLGVDATFDLVRDYYATFARSPSDTARPPLGIPLVVTSGMARTPAPGEALIATAVAEYVGVRPGSIASVELIHLGLGRPIMRRHEELRVALHSSECVPNLEFRDGCHASSGAACRTLFAFCCNDSLSAPGDNRPPSVNG